MTFKQWKANNGVTSKQKDIEPVKKAATPESMTFREWRQANSSTPVPESEPATDATTNTYRNAIQSAIDKLSADVNMAKDKEAAKDRFGGMTTDELFSYIPTDERDKSLYEIYMNGRTKAAEALDRQSRQAMLDAASAGNDAEGYRAFVGMPGASNEEIFGLAQAIRENNAQAKSLEPQKWLEYAEGLRESEARKQNLTEQGRELGRQAAAANEQGQAWEYSNIIKDYGELINSPDFAKKSQYNPSENSQTYKAINGDREAQDAVLRSNSRTTGFSQITGNGLLGYSGGQGDYLFNLTDTEKSIYNALYASSPEAADNFVEKLKPYLESRARGAFQGYAAAMAQRYPGLASAATIPAGAMQSGEYLTQLADIISDGKVNQNSADYRASQMSNTVRGEVSKMAEAKWGELGSAAYNLGMSMGDFLFSTAAGGGTKALSLGLMGTRAAANTVLNLKDRGLDDASAFTLGTIAGAAEILTESFSLEKLLNPDLIADGIAKNILKNFLAEASEEGASDLINWAAEYIYDAITGKNEAEWKQKVYDAIQNGADPNEAVLAAIQDNLVQLGTDMLSGGISGGIMSAAGTPLYLNQFNNSQQGQFANAIRGNEEGLQALIQSGLESPQNTESRQRAEKMEYQVAKGGTPSTLDVARLVNANQQQIENETAEQSGRGRLVLPRTVQNAPQVQAPPEAPPVPQETRNAPRLTLPTRDTQTPQQATETPRLTLPATQTDDQISAFGDQEETVARAAQAESDLVTKLRASKPGLLIDDYATNNIDETQRRAIDETAKRLGLRVAFSDTVSVGQDNAKIYDDGVVLIEKNNPNPVGFLYGHEMGHWLQQNSPEAYTEFAKAARATDPEWFKAREEATAAAYRDAGIEISPERIQEEVLSDYAGWLVQNEEVLNKFIEQNKEKPNVLRWLYEAIKALAAKLTGKEKQQANTAADLLLRAMNATEANVQNGIMSTGESRSSFGGVNALLADLAAKAKAEDYRGAKEHGYQYNNYVRKQTGWFKGGDGKWRFEIDDSGSSINDVDSIKRLNDPHYHHYAILMHYANESMLTVAQQSRAAQYRHEFVDKGIPQPSTVAQKFAAGIGTVGDILKHKELYRQYPSIAAIPLSFHDLGKTTLGQTSGGSITLNTSLLDDEKELRSTLLHEIQHIIQDKEGFAKGSNSQYWQRQIDNGMDTTRPSETSALREYNRIKAENPDLVRDVMKVTRMFEKNHENYRYVDENYWENKETGELVPRDDVWGEYDKQTSDLESKYGDTLNEYYDTLISLGSPEDAELANITGIKPRTAYEMYRDTYGEEEARNVEERADISPEVRRQFPPFAGSEDSVFVEPQFRKPRAKSSMKGLNADVTPESVRESDDNYMAAVNSGDMDTAQRMVDEAAKQAGYTIKAYHGTTDDFTKFSRGEQGRNHDGYLEFGGGFYFTPNENEAREWVRRGRSGLSGKAEPKVMSVYLSPRNIINADEPIPRGAEALQRMGMSKAEANFIAGRTYRFINYLAEDKGYSNTEIQDELKSLGYDAIDATYRDGTSGQYVVFDPDQIKSADPVTRDDTGRAIPLSERFNPYDDDIRNSLKGLDYDVAPESIKKYGQAPVGEKPYRDIKYPVKVTDRKNERVSLTGRTVLEAKVTPDAVVPTIADLVEKGAFSYNIQSDKAAISKAEETIKDKGWSTSLADWVKDVTAGHVSKSNTAMGWALYNNAANSGDVDTAMNVLDLIVRHQRDAAQALQATRILKKLSPEMQLYGVQRSVDNLIKELEERYGKKFDIQINRDLAQALLDAKTEDERHKALEALYKDIGRQLPATFIDKWNAWRYLAMLGNLRTHGRNIFGNFGFAPVVWAKDQVATTLEGIASAVSKGKVERTKGLVLPARDHDLVKAAWDRFPSVREEALGGGKYNDQQMANKWIEEGRTIFRFKPLEAVRRGNTNLLDAEDAMFIRPHYTYAFAQYCKANGITADQVRSGEGLDKADAYAIKEAQKATYRDVNAFSSFVSSLGRSADRKTGVGKAASAVLEGILPFRKTPANILVRGLEYSPVGLLKSLTYDLAQVMRTDADGNPRMSAAEMLDDVSEGLTGTGLLALGALLVKLGLLRGHGEDEKKERDFYDLMGYQNYALTLPNGKSLTLDWLAPEVLPLLVGANIYEKLQQSKGDVKMSDIIDAIGQISEPMLEMSMLQSLNDLLDSVGYAKEEGLSALSQTLSSAVTSYLTQAIPTLSGQIERTHEKLRMTTYTDKNKWLTKNMQYTLGKISAKIPGWDYDQIPYIDAWGRTEDADESWVKRLADNAVHPWYSDQTDMSEMEKELLRLYNVDPDKYGSVLPSKPSKYLTHDKERIDLTGEQYVSYATTKGQTAYNLMTKLTESEAYKNASDEDKAKMVDSVYDYAATIAKGELLESLGKTYDDYDKLKGQLDNGADIMDMIALAQEIKNADAENNANKSYDTLEVLSAFEALNLPEEKAEPLMEQRLSESQWEKYNTIKDAGVNYDTRLDIMRKYSELNANDEMKPGDKALEFSRYVDGLRLTDRQNQLVKSTYKFWSMVPAEATRYETFKASGLNEGKAKHTSEILSALEPLPGKEAVTDLQRYRAIAADKVLTDKEKLNAIGSIMGTELKTEKGNPTQWAKFNLALNNGQSLPQAIDLCENGRLDEFEKWTESEAKGQNVKWDVYDEFLKQTADLTGDKDANGKTISGSLKKKVAAYIDSLDLTPEQKDALLTDYNSTYKHDVTWHNGSYGSSSGSGRTYARSGLRLPTPERNAPGRLTLTSTPARPITSGLKLK